jgi:NTP pyrophosphatase (non-canonical NTP hydrolase)
MSIEKLEERVIEWANQRNLYRQSTDETRALKLIEEVGELLHEVRYRNIPDIAMEAGDVIVTLINLLHPLGLDLETCLGAAYEKIKDRQGKMINGTYVKSEDLE